MIVELSRDRSMVLKHTTLFSVQYTILTVGFSPVQKTPTVKIEYWNQHNVVCLETMETIPAVLNILFAVTLSNLSRNLSRNVKKDDFISRDVTQSNMSHATCNDHSIKPASANVWRQIDSQ